MLSVEYNQTKLWKFDYGTDLHETRRLLSSRSDIPAKEKVPANRYGRMHGDYLKKNNWAAYNELLLSGRLNRYLEELGEQADKMLAGAFIVMTVSVGCWGGILNYVKLRTPTEIRIVRLHPAVGLPALASAFCRHASDAGCL